MIKNYKFIVQYNGTKYNGWQRLPDNMEKSIQGKIEVLLSRLLDEDIKIIGSGRTDAGVHALAQTCNFYTEKKLPVDFLEQCNHYLPKDIRIIELEEAEERFHARYNAKDKVYMYRIDNTKFGNPFLKDFSYFVDRKLDVKKMRETAKYFIGEHDFTSFSKSKSKKKSSVRTISSIEIKEQDDIIEIYYKADGFLYNMVRMMTGALIGVGLGQIKPEEVEKLLKDKSRDTHRFVVPPQGLFLYKVEY
jgi:tRNA pseudouridine38-40 synthase